MTDSEFVPPTVGHEVWSDGSPRWVFCDNSECLLCATRSPRRGEEASGTVHAGLVYLASSHDFGGMRDEYLRRLNARDAATLVGTQKRTRRRLRIYFEPRDVWIGAYVAKGAIYVCPLPCIVIRWSR